MPRGDLFSTDDPILEAWTSGLNLAVQQRCPAFFDGSASAILVRRPEEEAGLGICLSDGIRLRHETVLALYFGAVRSWVPPGDYVLALPPFYRNSTRFDLSLDAGPYCRRANPEPFNMALLNHSCRDATVHIRQLEGGPLPYAVAVAPAGTAGGTRLRWDYDGGLSSGGFTTGQDQMVTQFTGPTTWSPCACRNPEPCPRRRLFPSTP